MTDELNDDTLASLLDDAASRATRYLSTLDTCSIAPEADAIARLVQLGEPLPDRPSDPASVLALLDDIGSPATTATAGGRYFGFVVGGSLPVTVAASWLATAWDNDAGMSLVLPAGAAVEEIARRWLLDILRLPPESGIGFVTGGTMADLTCLAAARGAVLAGAGWDVEAGGLFGAPPVTVVVGEEAHVSVFKALGLLGSGRERVVRLPVDGHRRMRVDALQAIDGPSIVITQAGNVITGAVDPVGEVCDRVCTSGA